VGRGRVHRLLLGVRVSTTMIDSGDEKFRPIARITACCGYSRAGQPATVVVSTTARRPTWPSTGVPAVGDAPDLAEVAATHGPALGAWWASPPDRRRPVLESPTCRGYDGGGFPAHLTGGYGHAPGSSPPPSCLADLGRFRLARGNRLGADLVGRLGEASDRGNAPPIGVGHSTCAWCDRQRRQV
jgi:hypothetical protein